MKKGLPCPKKNMFLVLCVVLYLVFGMNSMVASVAYADDQLEAKQIMEKARLTLEAFGRAPEMDGFRSLVKDARGVYISPQILRGAFIFGGSGGSGLFIVRDKESDNWSGPAFYTIGSISFGLQIGGDASEVVLLVMTERGVTALLSSSVKLGADVGVAVGPVGIGAAASTANVSADIISFSRSKGLYGGISLDGAVVKTRGDYNTAFYGKEVTPTDILISKTTKNPGAEGLLEMASKMAGSR